MANVRSAGTEPVVKIFIQETHGELQDHVARFKSQCVQKAKNAMPYANEDFKSTEFNGLIYEYDAQTLRDIQPEGQYRQALLDFFQDIANHESIRSNLILVNSESTYCQANQAFYDALRPVIASIPENGLNTIVILIVCSAAERAAVFNADRTRNPTSFGFSADANISHRPYFLGFDGTVHTIKEHIFVCRGKFLEDDFPTRICATELPTNTNNNNTRTSKIRDRERCCDAMIKEFPLHFIKSFKTDRDCIKVTKDHFIERIQNLIRTGGTTQANAGIRRYTDGRTPYDGTYCRSTAANPDPCGIDSESNIVNNSTKANVARYSNLIHLDKKLLGQLLFDVTRNGENFQGIWDSLSAVQKRDFATYRTSSTASDTIKNSTLLGLVLKNTTAKPNQRGSMRVPFPMKPAKMIDDVKFQIVRRLIDSGADVNTNGDSDNSILNLTLIGFTNSEFWESSSGAQDFGDIEFNPPSLAIQDYILFESNIDITPEINNTVDTKINALITKYASTRIMGNLPSTRGLYLDLLKRISTGNGIRLVDPGITGDNFFKQKRLTTTPRTFEETQAVLNKLREVVTVNGETKRFKDFIKDALAAIGLNTVARRQALFTTEGRIVGAAGGARRRNRRMTRKRKSKVTRRNRKSKTRKH
jgi:hypothetical protein